MSKATKRRIHHCACKMCSDHPYSSVAQQHQAINRVLATLDEQNRRRFVGLLALQQGERGIAPLARITGMSRNTIARGKREVEHPTHKRRRYIRAPGAGRPLTEKNSRASWRPSMNS